MTFRFLSEAELASMGMRRRARRCLVLVLFRCCVSWWVVVLLVCSSVFLAHPLDDSLENHADEGLL